MQNSLTATMLTGFMDKLNAAHESVLLVDYDGTLAPFQLERNRAYPYPGVIKLLDNIIRSGKTRVIVITGRPVCDLQTLLHPLKNLEAWGSHGTEHLFSDGTYQQAVIAPETAALLTQTKEWLIAAGLSSLAEIKPGGIAIHWRGLTDPEIKDVQTRLQKNWATFAERPEFKLLNFDSGFELRVAHPDKGDVVAAILEDLNPGAQIAFLGDDLTDEDAFRVLDNRGLSILVRPEYRETRAKIWLQPPHELIEFFEQWLNSISA